ncbi:MAG: sigma-54 dependent transcriptional regulator [Pirellulales bacterium]
MKILFADDEPSLQKLMSLELPRMGHEVTVCPDGQTAVAALELNTYDCLLVDLDMPGMNGLQVIARAKELNPDSDAIILTGKSSLDTAISALRNGVSDYLTKPCKLAEIDAVLNRVAEKRQLKNKYRALQVQLQRAEGQPRLIGSSQGMQRVRKLIDRVAPTQSAVLIRGETGTGKELVARAIHDQSPRAELAFVPINCGALPEALIESELFGHRKGAFTGASEKRIGLFEVAHGGTLFLDEIGELPLSMQAKLLRVLESGEIRRVGDNDAFQVDVRIVAATHRPLEDMVRDGKFREDLMFRINTFEIELPPLRSRCEDLGELCIALLGRFGRSAHAPHDCLAPTTLKLLEQHLWPGNVRELANVIEYATILCERLPILPEHLPPRFQRGIAVNPLKDLRPMPLKTMEILALQAALDRHGGDKPAAAEELGISLKTLYNKLTQLEESDEKAA